MEPRSHPPCSGTATQPVRTASGMAVLFAITEGALEPRAIGRPPTGQGLPPVLARWETTWSNTSRQYRRGGIRGQPRADVPGQPVQRAREVDPSGGN